MANRGSCVECLPLLRIGHEMHGAAEATPAWPRGRAVAVEQCEPTRTDAEQRATLQLRFFGLGKSQADLPDPRQVARVVGSYWPGP